MAKKRNQRNLKAVQAAKAKKAKEQKKKACNRTGNRSDHIARIVRNSFCHGEV